MTLPLAAFAQKKADREIMDHIRQHLSRLSGDSAGIHRSGTAYQYIESRFRSMGIAPAPGHGAYRQAVISDAGIKFIPGTSLSINGKALQPGKDFIPLPYSAEGSARGEPLIAVQEPKMPWVIDLHDHLNDRQPTSDSNLTATLYKLAVQAVHDRALAVLFYNSAGNTNDARFHPGQKFQPLGIPVVYINNPVAKRYFKDATASAAIQLQVAFSEKKDTAYNLIGYLDNHAPHTIIIGAHHAGDIAVMMELARLLKNENRAYRNENYLFIVFCNTKNDLSGSKFYTAHPATDLKQVDCMINLDLGRRPASYLQLGGIRTSPQWNEVLKKVKTRELDLRADTGRIASSDQLSFYQKNIPVLFISATNNTAAAPGDETALHLVKYLSGVVKALNREQKLSFTPVQ